MAGAPDDDDDATLDRKLSGLWDAEREVHEAQMLYSEVGNGGFDQYSFNSSAEHMDLAIACLERIGAKELAAVAKEAWGRFGPEGPSRDRSSRGKQLAAMTRGDESAFEDLDSRLYETSEDIVVLANIASFEHPELFRPTRQRQLGRRRREASLKFDNSPAEF